MVCWKSFFQVLENNPDIDNIYSLNLKAIKKDKKQLFSQIKQVKTYSKKTYDLVIDAQGLIKSAIVSKLLGKRVAGFSKDSIREKAASYFYKNKVSIAYDENTIDRNAKVLSKPLGFEILESDILDMKPFLYYKDEDKIIYEYLKDDKKYNICYWFYLGE